MSEHGEDPSLGEAKFSGANFESGEMGSDSEEVKQEEPFERGQAVTVERSNGTTEVWKVLGYTADGKIGVGNETGLKEDYPRERLAAIQPQFMPDQEVMVPDKDGVGTWRVVEQATPNGKVTLTMPDTSGGVPPILYIDAATLEAMQSKTNKGD